MVAAIDRASMPGLVKLARTFNRRLAKRER